MWRSHSKIHVGWKNIIIIDRSTFEMFSFGEISNYPLVTNEKCLESVDIYKETKVYALNKMRILETNFFKTNIWNRSKGFKIALGIDCIVAYF